VEREGCKWCECRCRCAKKCAKREVYRGTCGEGGVKREGCKEGGAEGGVTRFPPRAARPILFEGRCADARCE